jgi:branched-chain amino acid transport system substrate-binding protein
MVAKHREGALMVRKFISILTVIAMAGGSGSAQTIKVGLSGPLSGDFRSVGIAMQAGARIAVAEINKSGGVLGRQLELIERDDEANVETGTRVARELIGDQHVAAAIGFANAEVALAAQQYYQTARIPVMNAFASDPLIATQFAPSKSAANYIFQMAANDAVVAAMNVHEATRRQHLQAPAVLADDSGCEHGPRAQLEVALKNAGYAPSSVQTYSTGSKDMTAQLARVKAGDAGFILACGGAQDLVGIANSMARLGWKLPLMGGEMFATPEFMDRAGPNGDGAMMPQTFIQEGNTETRARFISAYRFAERTIRIPSPDAAAQAHDSVLLLKAAIEQAKSTDGPKTREALENLSSRVEGVVTIYEHPFSATDHEAISASIPVIGVVRGRHVVPAHETDLAGARVLRLKTN